MAVARIVVDDAPNEVVQQLVRTVNGLLLMIEEAEAAITATATAEEVLNAWADAVRTGRDNNPATVDHYVGSGAELVGVRLSPRVPARPKRGTVALEVSDA